MIENLSTEEYSYFLAYGLTDDGYNGGPNRPELASLCSLLQSFDLDEAFDSNYEEGMSQHSEDVCSVTSHDDE